MEKELSFKVKKDGTKIVEPDTSLKDTIGTSLTNIVSDRKVEQAQHIIKDEGKSFTIEVQDEIKLLNDIYIKFSNSTTPEEIEENFQQVKKKALAIKSSSGVYGYNFATKVAKSLFNFCEEHNCNNERAKKIISLHIQALKIIFKNGTKDSNDKISKELLAELQIITK